MNKFIKHGSQVDIHEMIRSRKMFLESGNLSDCEFVVYTDSVYENIRAHRMILAMASPVFETMFYGHMAEPKDELITVLDVKIHAFNALLMYIYTEETNFKSCDEVCDIYYAAHKYMIPPLAELCLKYIRQNLQTNSACCTLSFFRLFDIELDLQEKCLHMIRSRTDEITKDESFADISQDILKEILLQDNLNIREIDLWNCALKWSEQRCSKEDLEVNPLNLRKIMHELLPFFRFLTMSPTEFTNGPAQSDILDKEECLIILMNLSSPNSRKMPQNFSTSTTPRSRRNADIHRRRMTPFTLHSNM